MLETYAKDRLILNSAYFCAEIGKKASVKYVTMVTNF